MNHTESQSAEPVALADHLVFRNGKVSPDRAESGRYEVFGSNGPIGRSDFSNAEGPLIVIGRVGSYCGSLFYSTDPVWVSDNAIVCTAKDRSQSRFWYYALDALSLNRRSGGSGQPLLNQHVLASIRYAPPSVSKRIAIAEVLGALDDKIAANTILSETADALAQATLDHMLDDSESVPLTEVAQFVNGRAFTNGATGIGRVVIRIAELNSGIGGSTVYNEIDVADQHIARPGDLLFAWSGSLTLHRWFRPEAIVNQHIFKVIPSNGYSIWCAYGLIARKLDEFKAIAASKATTMGHIQRRHLEERVDVPARSTIEHCDSLMTTLWNRALLAEQESLVLASARDALLPQLMSGKIRVKDAEKAVEEVL